VGRVGTSGKGEGRYRSGPVYDDAMKVLAADDLDAVLTLVGVHGQGAREMNVELAGSAKRVDLLARTASGIVHVEFMKDPDPELDLRMVEYWVRVRRQVRERRTPIAQFVLVLGDDVVAPDRCLEQGREVLRWTVVRLGDLDPDLLLERPTTAAVAALARGSESQRAQVLTAAAELIAATDPGRSRTLLTAATILASIVLPSPIIGTALKEATSMPVLIRDTPLGREIYEEARNEGRQEARQAVSELTALVLRRAFGDDPRIDTVAERLADLPDDERLTVLTTATSLDDLQR